MVVAARRRDKRELYGAGTRRRKLRGWRLASERCRHHRSRRHHLVAVIRATPGERSAQRFPCKAAVTEFTQAGICGASESSLLLKDSRNSTPPDRGQIKVSTEAGQLQPSRRAALLGPGDDHRLRAPLRASPQRGYSRSQRRVNSHRLSGAHGCLRPMEVSRALAREAATGLRKRGPRGRWGGPACAAETETRAHAYRRHKARRRCRAAAPGSEDSEASRTPLPSDQGVANAADHTPRRQVEFAYASRASAQVWKEGRLLPSGISARRCWNADSLLVPLGSSWSRAAVFARRASRRRTWARRG
jgi:hypothetical protein